MKRRHTLMSIVLILTAVALLLCGFSAGSTKEKLLSKEEKAALEEVTENTYTFYEVQSVQAGLSKLIHAYESGS